MFSEDKSILVVDDDPVSRKLLTRHLENFQVILGRDGIEGLQLFEEFRPDVVITDLKMPGKDGKQLLKEIKQLSPSTPVIILSGVGTMTDVIEFLRLGANDYLEKPILNKEIVIHIVNKAFQTIRFQEMTLTYQENLEKEVAKKVAELEKELEARTAAENNMKEAREEWERTFNAIPDKIAIIDRNFQVLQANRTMSEVLNNYYTREKTAFSFKKLHRDNSPPEFNLHEKLLEDGNSHIMELYEEVLGGHVELTVVPYYDKERTSLLGSVHIVRDINHRRAMEDDRKKMQVQLLHSQKLESVGQLAAGIAHEINTPVQFVSSNTTFLNESFEDVGELVRSYDLLFQAAKDNQVTDTLLQTIADTKESADWEYLEEEIPIALKQSQEGLQRVASIVQAMKEFSHPGSKDKESHNINTIIKTTGIVARNEWKYVAKLEMDLDPELPSIQCFSDDIGQVLLNMIINAAHAIEDKIGKNPTTEKGNINIVTRTIEGFVEVRVSDTGVGMEKEVVQKIFDPFFTTKKVGRGTGQGLTIAWSIIVDKHDGGIQIESTPGEGTTFIVHLPKTSE